MALNLVFTVTDERTLGPGTILAGKYRVERVLGTGGMGVVVAAIHEQLEERVAVKLLRSERLAQPEAVERVLREARATVKIQSDHVVRVFDVGTLDDGAPYIVMEYLAGCDVAQLMCAEGRLSIEDAATYVRQACDAIGKAHALGIVHRDLKPANLFLAVRDDTATIKVLDFGISKLMAGERFDPALTGAAAVLGSPTYMSPEQIASPRDVDARTDVWSLGVILFELVTGAHPFVGETFALLARQITDQPTPSVRGRRADAPEVLDAIIARCLAKHRDDRYPDVAALAAALAPLANQSAHRSPPALAKTAAAATPPQAESRPLRSEQGVADPKLPLAIELPRKTRRYALGGLAALAATGAVVTFGMSRGGNPAAQPLPTASPLVGGILACPQFVAHGVDEPSDWLGAAGATIACARAQARMGGHSARTLIPAELLDLPRDPIDHYPQEAFSAPHARSRAIVAARSRSGAWLDGDIARANGRFQVTLVLRASVDDRELGRGAGDDAGLLEAIRAAMTFEHDAIPSAPPNDPFLVEWLGARTADAAVAITDMSFVSYNEDPKRECAALQQRADITAAMKGVFAISCAAPLKRPVAAPRRDTSSPGALRLSIELDAHLDLRPLEPDLAMLDAALAKLTDHEQRAFLLGEKAAVLSAHHLVDRATEVGLAAVHEDPKALDVIEPAWVVLSWLRSNTNLPAAAVAWIPWSTEAYCMCATQTEDAEVRVRNGRRDHILAPSSADRAPSTDQGRLWNLALVDFLVADDKRDEARVVAAETADPQPRVAIAASEGNFAKALQLAHDTIPHYADDDAYGAMYAASTTAMIEHVLGRPASEVDAVVARYVMPEPSIAASDVITDLEIAHGCAYAPRDVATRCLARLRQIAGGPVGNIEGVLDGAEKYVAGDYAGAALAWRPMLNRPGWQLETMRELLATAAEHIGDDELVERVDAPTLAIPGRYNGADPAYVRAARRAERRHDAKAARVWAQKVIAAWSTADIQVPAVAEMRKLLARLP